MIQKILNQIYLMIICSFIGSLPSFIILLVFLLLFGYFQYLVTGIFVDYASNMDRLTMCRITFIINFIISLTLRFTVFGERND